MALGRVYMRTIWGQLSYQRGFGWIYFTTWLALFFALFAPVAYAAPFNPTQALRISQAAVGRVVADQTFRDSNGKTVRLSDFRGKPLVVSFVYSSCLTACPMITRNIDDVRDVAIKALGEGSFSIISVGFDAANDSPEKMKLYAISNDVGDKPDWSFLSADAATIKRLANQLGFTYRPRSEGFDHLSQVTVIDAKGKIYRQVYGDSFELPLLVDPLKELVFGTTAPFSSIDDLVKRVRLFCTVYDPASDSYRFDYSLLIQIAFGFLILGLMSNYVIRGWLVLYRRRAK